MNIPIVFVVGGQSYCEDAVVSAESYKRNNPDIQCIIATDHRGDVSSVFDYKIQLGSRRYPDMWYLDSCRYYNETFDIMKDDYDALCFVDSDTYCDAPLDDMFRLMERFDIALSHAVNRHTTGKVCNIPDAFPEHEIGVMLVQTNEHIRNLFSDWLELYETHPEVYENNDQGPLRDALWLNKLINMYVLPEEFHARWGFGVTVVSRVRILHSRSTGDAPTNAQVAKEINSVGGRRLYRPGGFFWGSVVGDWKYE